MFFTARLVASPGSSLRTCWTNISRERMYSPAVCCRSFSSSERNGSITWHVAGRFLCFGLTFVPPHRPLDTQFIGPVIVGPLQAANLSWSERGEVGQRDGYSR